MWDKSWSKRNETSSAKLVQSQFCKIVAGVKPTTLPYLHALLPHAPPPSQSPPRSPKKVHVFHEVEWIKFKLKRYRLLKERNFCFTTRKLYEFETFPIERNDSVKVDDATRRMRKEKELFKRKQMTGEELDRGRRNGENSETTRLTRHFNLFYLQQDFVVFSCNGSWRESPEKERKKSTTNKKERTRTSEN